MNPVLIGLISGVFGGAATLAIGAFLLLRKRVKLPMLFQREGHKVMIDCKGKTIGQVVQVVHEHSLWFAEQFMDVRFETMPHSVIAYNLSSDSDLAIFKLRWAGQAEYICEK
jgi:hypothetical protein